jgi:hypothetical protein
LNVLQFTARSDAEIAAALENKYATKHTASCSKDR